MREGAKFVVTCNLRYIIDPCKLPEFEQYARIILLLAGKYGSTHHESFLPHSSTEKRNND
jgi:hypothetical protein